MKICDKSSNDTPGERDVLLRRYLDLDGQYYPFNHQQVAHSIKAGLSSRPPTHDGVSCHKEKMTLSVIAVLLPAAFYGAVQPSSDGVDPLTNAQEGHDILAISHGTSDCFFVWLSQLTPTLLGCNGVSCYTEEKMPEEKYPEAMQCLAAISAYRMEGVSWFEIDSPR